MAVDGQSQQFHKRFNGFVGFYRGWEEYKNGFGDLRREFWLGKEKTHQLTEIPSQLRVEINTTSAGYRYTNFSTHCSLGFILLQQLTSLLIIVPGFYY